MRERGLERGFAPELEREALRAREEVGESLDRELAEGRRRDLRDLPTLTIDPAGAGDFDDAISAEALAGGGVRVWVHIADVAAYVPEGSLVDLEARRRGTSVYVPGALEPMLPHALSSDACSLIPQAERAAVTVELDLRASEVLRSAFHRSLIRSDVRLDYDRVDRIFAGEEPAGEPWAETLALAREAAAELGGARARAGGLLLDSSEPEFVFDDAGNPSMIVLREQTESHRLIEHLMIAANEAVARLLSERAIPCLYRVHERPEPERVRHLIEQLASLGIPTPALADSLSPSQALELLGDVSRRVDRFARGASDRASGPWGGRMALRNLILRSVKQAHYSPANAGHSGLRSACYCHFTSPIRRYPDLVCHRALLSALGADVQAPRAGELGELGEETSASEREAMAIERDADDIASCFALERELYEEGFQQTFHGEVTGLISAGAFIAFGQSDTGAGPLYEGMLPVRQMRLQSGGRDWWELNELGTILRGERSGETLRLGDEIEVQVARVDGARGRVDLLRAVDQTADQATGRGG